MGALADIRGDGAELGASADWNIETVIDWKRIVSMYYQMNGKKDEPDEQDWAPALGAKKKQVWGGTILLRSVRRIVGQQTGPISVIPILLFDHFFTEKPAPPKPSHWIR
ncbi:hypothetical protein ANCDUO_04987 [Ancylostoma duodenale]|uniref:Uncharacterized protein n=1 Tax=Ancylostoma duodenale TaxID=51022 RepID=A0A0C2H5J1_9BILA|nr:hypothetical protein ANCDUO_04987 [Ancylostoma duodenale]